MLNQNCRQAMQPPKLASRRQYPEKRSRRSSLGGVVFTGALLVLLAGTASADKKGPPSWGAPAETKFQLTLLHNNDGESQLINAPGQPDFGGADRFKTLVDQLRWQSTHVPHGPQRGIKRATLLISSGDNFLAGPRFAASLAKGVPFYDSLALRAIGYDALVVGNHEFDFGPDVLADFIRGFRGTTTFLSANLDFSGEPALAALANRRILSASKVLKVQGEKIGIVAATTPRLPFISSPRNVQVDEDVAGVVQAEVDRLTRKGVDKIVFASHLQNLEEDRALIALLDDVDVAIAGGGDELLANPSDLLVPGDSISKDPVTGEPYPYPLIVKDRDGTEVPVVTTSGDYKYVGRLVANFDRKGRVIGVDKALSGPIRVSGVAPDAVAPNPWVKAKVVEPVAEFQADLAANVLATSEVSLDGSRPNIRLKETNLGNLMADALLNTGVTCAASSGVTPPQIAFQNGGGIRNSSVIPPGDITELNTFEIAAFANFVVVVPNVPRATIKAVLENAVSKQPGNDGRFAHVAGLTFEFDANKTAQLTDTNGTITTAGERVKTVTLDDGTKIVENFAVVTGSDIAVATLNFLANGGDQYPLPGLSFINCDPPATYQEALVEQLINALGGVVTADDYPEGGEGRITDVTPGP